MDNKIYDKLKDIAKKYDDLEEEMIKPENISDHKRAAVLGRERREIEVVVEKYREYMKLDNELKALTEDNYDEEMKDLVEEEIADLKSKLESLEKDILIELIPKDPNDSKNIIIEIRAGAGGDEASIFAADVYRMYVRYIESLRWSHSVVSSSEFFAGGFKEIIFQVKGKDVYGKFKFESGVHRVQRVPKTESAGRIHTSTITVAVLPEADDVDVVIEPKDIKVDTYRSSGAGGQSVNTTDSAIRITHIPTGMVVTCQDERSQIKNKSKALKLLKTKLLDYEIRKNREAMDGNRKSQIGSGDRSEKIRTYNYPQSRVTDHRIGLTLYKLDSIMEGDLEEIISTLSSFDQAEKLKSAF